MVPDENSSFPSGPSTLLPSEKFSTPLLHPMGGSNPATLLQAMRRYGPFNRQSLLTRCLTVFIVLLRLPFYELEKLIEGSKIREAERNGDPVFIIGHWRSGTTHLHNLFSRDPQFGWISLLQTAMPWDFLGKLKIAPAIIEKVMPETRGMDNVPLSLDSPQEEEMALGNMGLLCYYYCYYFPAHFRELYNRSILLEGLTGEELNEFARHYRYLINKLSLAEANRGKRLILKNPACTARTGWLKKLFPGAKFVHIVRNPYEVFCSTLNHYNRTMSAFSWQDWEGLDFEELTLENYRLIMRRYLEERSLLPPDSLLELTFEGLEGDPLAEMRKVYNHFQFPHREEALRLIGDYLEGQRHYRRNAYALSGKQVEKIRERWGFALREWGYDFPTGIRLL